MNPPSHHRRFRRSRPNPPRPEKPESASDPKQLIEGVLDLKGRSGFILSEVPGVPDVLVQGPSLKLAMDGDRVRVRLHPPKGDRRTGEIIGVVTRARQTLIGLFRHAPTGPEIRLQGEDSVVRISNTNGLSAEQGDLAVVRITDWPTRETPAAGTLIEVLGPPGRAGVELKGLVRKFELPDEFPTAVLKEAEAFGAEVPDARLQDRQTLFDERTFTIDGADAKDFDDAVSIQKTETGWRLGVHIADVASYVTEGGALDAEAYTRGTSVYLSGSVIPMLPFPLSDNLCSLRPDRVRLTMSCVMEIDASGQVVAAKVFDSAIRSAKRFTYEEVDEILKGDAPAELSPAIVADVREMGRLAALLRRRRFERGSLDFDFPEPYIRTDAHGRPIEIRKRLRLESHRLVEDFMLAANEAVARYMRDVPFLYRIHETPDLTKMETLKKTLTAVGAPVGGRFDPQKPATLQRILQWSDRHPARPMIQTAVLRSLKQAVYSPVNSGHFGLASACYAHFTSPIRRYPDLVVHRLLKERIHGRLDTAHQREWTQRLPAIAAHTSRRERVAVEAEREYFDLQRVRFMESRVGEEFDATITGVTNFGFFAVLDDAFVEGLVRVADLDDYYFFDEVRMILRGRRSGHTFAIGDRVRVQLAAANAEKRQLDFRFLSAPGASTGRSSHRRRGGKGEGGRPGDRNRPAEPPPGPASSGEHKPGEARPNGPRSEASRPNGSQPGGRRRRRRRR